MSNVVQQGSLGGITWPLHQDGKPITTVDRTSRNDVLSAVKPAVLLPSPQPLDYQLWAKHELPTQYTPLPLLEQQLSFFARHLGHEGPIPAELLQELLLEQLEGPAAAAATAARGNRLAALQAQLSTQCSTPPPPAANTLQQQQQQQQGSAQAGAASKGAAASTGDGMSSCGHAGSAVLVLSVAGNASQQLVLTVLQPGDLPTHLDTQPPACNAAARASGVLQDSRGAGGWPPLAPAAAAAAAAGFGDAGQQEEASCVQLSAAVPAVLDLGSTVQQVGLRHLPPAVTACWQDAMATAHASTTAAGAGPAAAAAAGQQAPPGGQTDAAAGGQAGSGQQQQQQHRQHTHQQGPPAMPVALVWARCSSKVYAALVTYTAPAPATAITSRHQHNPEQQQQHSAEDNLQQQQSQQEGQPVQSGLLASSGWRLVLLGVAALPAPLLAAEWHPLLPQAVLGCSDGSVWLVTVPEELPAQAIGLQQQQQQQQVWLRQQGPPVCLHPDDRLPRLLLHPQGTLGWFTAAAQRAAAAAAAAAAASTAGGGAGGGVAPLLLAIGAHPRQLLAACGGTLMRHDLSPADSTTQAQQQQQQQDGQAASSPAAAAATVAHAGASKLPGKLLLQLPDPEVICALATWPGALCHWQQAAAAGPSAAAAAAAAGVGQSAGCVHVRHLLAVATSRQLLLLDLRKAASEPLIVWQHAVDSRGTPSSHPSVLLLLPTPPSEAVAAASCSKDCFEHRAAASAAAGALRTGTTAAAAGDGQLTAAAAGAGGTGRHAACGASSLDAAAVQPPSSSRAGDEAVHRVPQALQGFDPRLYPSQMFQLGSESQGAAALGDVPLFNTQASQFGDAAAWNLHGTHLQQQQQQHEAGVQDGMQQQQLSGDRSLSGPAAATRVAAPSPAAAAAAVARRVARPSGTATGSSSSDTRGPSVPSSELCGVIVWGSRGSGDIFTVNFRLQWAAGLAPTALPLHQTVSSLSAKLRGLSTNTTPPAAAAGPGGTSNVLPAAGGVSSNQQVPGAAALGFITKAMQTLSMSAIAGAAESAVDRSSRQDDTDLDRPKVRTGEGNGPSVPAASGVRNVSSHSFQRSPLGAWQLPSVVQVTTPGPGQLLARPVSESVRSERVQELRLSRAAAAAARGDARSASEVGLLPGAALDISKSAIAQKTLKLMAAAPDTQGIALCSIPWCWSGGLARALLLRSTADGDLSLQLCTTQHIGLAVTGQEEAAEQQQQQQQQGQRRQFKVGTAATAAANGTSGLLAASTEAAVAGREQLMQQQQWGRKPVLEVVTAVGSSGSGAADTAASQQQQQQLDNVGLPAGQQQPAASLASQATVLQPLPQLQLQEGSAQPCVRSFEALQSWLDAQVDPPQLATAAAAARLTRLNYDKKRLEQAHAERQLVQLPAHTGLVLTLTQQQHQGRQEPQQQQQEQQEPDLNGSREQQSQQQQQQQPSTISTAPQCRWPDSHSAQPPGASHQASMHLIPNHTLLQFGPAGSSAQPMSAAAASATAAAAAEHDGLQQQEEQQQQRMLSRPTAGEVVSALEGQQLPLTLMELHYHLLLLEQQQQQQQEQGQRAGSSSRKRRALAALDDPPEEHRQERQQQQGSNAAAGSSRVLRSSSRAAARHGPSGPTAAAAAAAAAASDHVDDTVHQQLSRVDVAKLLQHQLPEPQLQLAAWVLAAQHSTAAAPAAINTSTPEQQQQQQSVDPSLTGAAAVVTAAGRQSPVLSNHVLVDGGRVAALFTQLDKLLSQQQQQQQQDLDDDSTASRLQGYQLRPLTLSYSADIIGHDDAGQQQLPAAANTPASQNHQPAAAAAVAGGAHADESGMRYVVQPVGPGVWDPQGTQGLELAGPSAALARAGGAAAAVVREVNTTTRSHQPQQQQQQQRQFSQQQQQGVHAAGAGGVVPPSASSSFDRLAGTVGGAAGNGAAVDLFATQAGPEPDADPAGGGGGGGSVSSKAVSAEFAPFGTLLQHSTAAQQLLDVTPRLISQHHQQQQGAAGASGTAAAAAAAAAGSMLAAGRVSRSAAVTPTAGAAAGDGQAVVRAPPGLLALAMSQEAQQRWLLLQDEWTLPGGQPPLRDVGEPVGPPSTHTRTAAAADESAGLQRQVQAGYQHKQQGQGISLQPARPTTTQQQQQQRLQRWPELLDSRTSVPVRPAAAAAATQQQQQQQQRGSALLAALGGQQRPAPPAGRRQQQLPVQQQQKHAPLLLRDKQPMPAEDSQHLQQQGITGRGQHSTQQQQLQQQQRVVQSQQQQQQPPAPQQFRQWPLSHPSQQRQMMLLHQQQPQQQQQQQQQQGPLPSHPSQQQQQQQQPPQQQGSLLSRLTQQQQQQQPGQPSSARGRSSLLMPSNRRR